MSASNDEQADKSQTVNVRGRQVPYLQRRRIRRRDYYLLKQIGSPLRERYLAFDPYCGPGGDFFLVQFWPPGPRIQQYLRVLKHLKNDCLPRAVEWQPGPNSIDVVLTWVEGISLTEYFRNIHDGQRPPTDPAQAVRLIWGLANAVCKLCRNRQVAHGDIQPANVIITDHTSRLILIDFGSAWTTETTAFREQGHGHNRLYAAPELQTDKIPSGFHADQFSVSVLLFELLTQQLPYGGLGGKAGRPENIDRTRDSLVAPSQISPACQGLPGSLRDGVDRVTLRGLELDPNSTPGPPCLAR